MYIDLSVLYSNDKQIVNKPHYPCNTSYINPIIHPQFKTPQWTIRPICVMI